MRKYPANADVFPAVTWFRGSKLFLAQPSDSRKYVCVRSLMRKLPGEKLPVNKLEQARAGERQFQTNMAQKTLNCWFSVSSQIKIKIKTVK